MRYKDLVQSSSPLNLLGITNEKNYGHRYWSKYVSELQVSLTRGVL